jgi:hypothetical protein
VGFDPTICGSEDRRDILATLRARSSRIFKRGSISIDLMECK